MSVESKIVSAMSFTGLPCRNGIYKGTATTYLTFNANSIPADFADDAPQHERWLVQLHLYAPVESNTIALRKQIKAAIQCAGFTFPSQIDASGSLREGDMDSMVRHIVFEFETAEGMDE